MIDTICGSTDSCIHFTAKRFFRSLETIGLKTAPQVNTLTRVELSVDFRLQVTTHLVPALSVL